MIKKGFTLVEILVVMAIFSMVSMVAINSFFSTYKIQQRSSSVNALISESRILMDKVVQMVEQNDIDYEEYFRQCVVLKKCPIYNYQHAAFNDGPDTYGEKDGLYAWQFFDPGNDGDGGVDSFGLLCQKNDGTIIDFPHTNCASGPLRFSEDINLGSIYQPDAGKSAFSFGGEYSENNFEGTLNTTPAQDYVLDGNAVVVDQLYLKSQDAKRKMIVAREPLGEQGAEPDGYMLSLLELEAGAIDTHDYAGRQVELNTRGFECADGYDCTGGKGLRSDFELDEEGANTLFSQAKPISPFRLNIKDLQFRIEPLNDPELYFAQLVSDRKIPSVTITMVVTASNKNNLPILRNEDFEYILKQTVVVD